MTTSEVEELGEGRFTSGMCVQRLLALHKQLPRAAQVLCSGPSEPLTSSTFIYSINSSTSSVLARELACGQGLVMWSRPGHAQNADPGQGGGQTAASTTGSRWKAAGTSTGRRV